MRALFAHRVNLVMENLALHQQLAILTGRLLGHACEIATDSYGWQHQCFGLTGDPFF